MEDKNKYLKDAFDNAKNDNDKSLNETIASLVENDEDDEVEYGHK